MMTREQRAKQFMPFDAMKGLQEALRDREERHARTERHEMSEQMQEAVSDALQRVERGCTVSVSCYRRFHDDVLTGRVTELSRVHKYLAVGEEKIFFEDIYAVEIVDGGL